MNVHHRHLWFNTLSLLAGRWYWRAWLALVLLVVPALYSTYAWVFKDTWAVEHTLYDLARGLDSLFAIVFGMLLGSATASLWGGEKQLLVPRYRTHLAWVTVVLGFVIYGLLMTPAYLLLQLLSYVEDRPTAIVGFWWNYLILGGAFVYAFFMLRKVHWLVRFAVTGLLVFSGLILPYVFAEYPTTGAWSLYHPIVVLALLLGPHNWFWFMRWHRGGVLESGEVAQVLMSNRMVGTGMDAWLWQSVYRLIPRRLRQHSIWLLLPMGWVSMLFMPLFILAVVLLVHYFSHDKDSHFITTISAGGVFGVMASFFLIRTKSVDRYALLPQTPTRLHLPRRVMGLYQLALVVAFGLLWLPSMVAAHWSGLSHFDFMLVVGLMAVAILGLGVWQVFHVFTGLNAARQTGWSAVLYILTTILLLASFLMLRDGAKWAWLPVLGVLLMFVGLAIYFWVRWTRLYGISK